MNNRSWVVFSGLGLLFLIYALHNLIWLPYFQEASNWNWLSGDQEVIQFINLNFQAQGTWVLGFAFFVIFTAVSGFRRQERWAWYVLWIVPVMLGLISLIMPWILPVTAILILIAVATLLASRPLYFQPRAKPA